MSTDTESTTTTAGDETKSCCGGDTTSSSCCGGGEKSSCCSGKGGFLCFSDLSLAMLLLRAWIGLRMLAAGIVKFKSIGPDGSMTINLENYYGKEGDVTSGWIAHAYKPFYEYGGLPEPMAKLYTGSLGWLMLLGGFMIFFGITNRLALVFGAAVMLSLSFGLFTLDDSQEIGYIASQFGLFVAAIALAKHNRLMVFGKF
jgi:hypothetical protein